MLGWRGKDEGKLALCCKYKTISLFSHHRKGSLSPTPMSCSFGLPLPGITSKRLPQLGQSQAPGAGVGGARPWEGGVEGQPGEALSPSAGICVQSPSPPDLEQAPVQDTSPLWACFLLWRMGTIMPPTSQDHHESKISPPGVSA